jgi:hypothetical protein
MIKIIIITISLLLFVQFVLYYCNVDLFKMYLKGDANVHQNHNQHEVEDKNVKELEESKEKLKVFINELKQYDDII